MTELVRVGRGVVVDLNVDPASVAPEAVIEETASRAIHVGPERLVRVDPIVCVLPESRLVEQLDLLDQHLSVGRVVQELRGSDELALDGVQLRRGGIPFGRGYDM